MQISHFYYHQYGKYGVVVSSDVLIEICTALDCTEDDIIEIRDESGLIKFYKVKA